jgi:hypothetical protein
MVLSLQTLQTWGLSALGVFRCPDFRLPPRCGWHLRSSWILRSVEW